MQCPQCGASIVRFPCPVCEYDNKNLDNKDDKIEENHERLVKPSDLLRSKKNISDDERLLKPSEILKEKEVIKPPEQMIKPSELKGSSAVNPNFKVDETGKLLPSENVPIGSIKHKEVKNKKPDELVKPSELRGLSPHQKEKISSRKQMQIVHKSMKKNGKKIMEQKPEESNEEYKERVRNTLMEVIGLLEKLVE